MPTKTVPVQSVAEAYNRAWGAVDRATRGMYPNGEAARGNRVVLSTIDEQVVAASGGYGERVEDLAALPAALARALRVTREERRQALLNVICE